MGFGGGPGKKYGFKGRGGSRKKIWSVFASNPARQFQWMESSLGSDKQLTNYFPIGGKTNNAMSR